MNTEDILKVVVECFEKNITADGWLDCGTPMASILGVEDFLIQIRKKLKRLEALQLFQPKEITRDVDTGL